MSRRSFCLKVVNIPEGSDLKDKTNVLMGKEKSEDGNQRDILFRTPSEFKKAIAKGGGNGWDLHFVHIKTGCWFKSLRDAMEELLLKYTSNEKTFDDHAEFCTLKVPKYRPKNEVVEIKIKSSFIKDFFVEDCNKNNINGNNHKKLVGSSKVEKEQKVQINGEQSQKSTKPFSTKKSFVQENDTEPIPGYIKVYFPVGKESECDNAVSMALFNVQRSIISNLSTLDYFVKMVGEIHNFDCKQPEVESEDEENSKNIFYEEDEESEGIDNKVEMNQESEEVFESFPVTKIVDGKNVLIYEGEEDDEEFNISKSDPEKIDVDNGNKPVELEKETEQMFNVNFEMLSDFNKRTKPVDMFDIKIPTYVKVDCSSLTKDKKKLKGGEDLTTVVQYLVKPKSEDRVFELFASHLNRIVLMGINKKRDNAGLEQYDWKELDSIAKPLRFLEMLKYYKSYVKSLVEKSEKCGQHQKKLFFFSYMEIIELFEENFFLDVPDMGKIFWEKFTDNTRKIQEKTIQIFGIKLDMINEKIVSKEKNKNNLIKVFKKTIQRTAYSLCNNDFEDGTVENKTSGCKLANNEIKLWAKTEIDEILKDILYFLDLEEKSDNENFKLLEKRIFSFFSLLLEKRKTMTNDHVDAITKSILQRVTSNSIEGLSDSNKFSSLFLMINNLCNSINEVKKDTFVILEKEKNIRHLKTLYNNSSSNVFSIQKTAIKKRIREKLEREKKLLVDSYEGQIMKEKFLRIDKENEITSLLEKNAELKKGLEILQEKCRKRKHRIGQLEYENKRGKVVKTLIQKIATEQGLDKTLLDDICGEVEDKKSVGGESLGAFHKENENKKKVIDSDDREFDPFFGEYRIGETQTEKQKEVKNGFYDRYN